MVQRGRLGHHRHRLVVPLPAEHALTVLPPQDEVDGCTRVCMPREPEARLEPGEGEAESTRSNCAISIVGDHGRRNMTGAGNSGTYATSDCSKVLAGNHSAVSLLYRYLPPVAGPLALYRSTSNTGCRQCCHESKQKKRYMAKARLLIVDDHALMCQGLRAILEPEYAVVGICHDGESVLPAARQLNPDVVLLDLSLPGKTGAEVLHELMTGTTTPPAIVVLTMHVERALAEHMIAAGARAFVPKDARLPELRTAIDAARTGQRYISPRVPPHLEADAHRYPRGYLQLTSRERQI